jgi:magnesium transporter
LKKHLLQSSLCSRTSYSNISIVLSLFDTRRTRDIFQVNPTLPVQREEAAAIQIDVHDYNAEKLDYHEFNEINQCRVFKDNQHVTWINIDGIRKQDIETICNCYNIHQLIVEDILSVGQRPKMDDMNNILYCLLNMLYFNEKTGDVETEQISIVLGKDFVISFQEDAERDVFNSIREKLKINNSKLRQSGADYLCYAMLDMIVDHYFLVMEKLGERIESLEEKIIRSSNTRALAEINDLRKELIVLKRNVSPVREIVNGFMRSDSPLLAGTDHQVFQGCVRPHSAGKRVHRKLSRHDDEPAGSVFKQCKPPHERSNEGDGHCNLPACPSHGYWWHFRDEL